MPLGVKLGLAPGAAATSGNQHLQKCHTESLGKNHGHERIAQEMKQSWFQAHWNLVRPRGVEERDALLDRRPDQGNHLLPVTRRAVTEAHAHAAQPDGRDFQMA